MRKSILALGLAAALLPTPSSAQSARGGEITACSRFGTQCISAPVRPARFGAEVRLPGGTWISCAGSCKDTLRDETIDFWAKREFERGAPDGRRRR